MINITTLQNWTSEKKIKIIALQYATRSFYGWVNFSIAQYCNIFEIRTSFDIDGYSILKGIFFWNFPVCPVIIRFLEVQASPQVTESRYNFNS